MEFKKGKCFMCFEDQVIAPSPRIRKVYQAINSLLSSKINLLEFNSIQSSLKLCAICYHTILVLKPIENVSAVSSETECFLCMDKENLFKINGWIHFKEFCKDLSLDKTQPCLLCSCCFYSLNKTLELKTKLLDKYPKLLKNDSAPTSTQKETSIPKQHPKETIDLTMETIIGKQNLSINFDSLKKFSPLKKDKVSIKDDPKFVKQIPCVILKIFDFHAETSTYNNNFEEKKLNKTDRTEASSFKKSLEEDELLSFKSSSKKKKSSFFKIKLSKNLPKQSKKSLKTAKNTLKIKNKGIPKELYINLQKVKIPDLELQEKMKKLNWSMSSSENNDGKMALEQNLFDSLDEKQSRDVNLGNEITEKNADAPEDPETSKTNHSSLCSEDLSINQSNLQKGENSREKTVFSRSSSSDSDIVVKKRLDTIEVCIKKNKSDDTTINISSESDNNEENDDEKVINSSKERRNSESSGSETNKVPKKNDKSPKKSPTPDLPSKDESLENVNVLKKKKAPPRRKSMFIVLDSDLESDNSEKNDEKKRQKTKNLKNDIGDEQCNEEIENYEKTETKGKEAENNKKEVKSNENKVISIINEAKNSKGKIKQSENEAKDNESNFEDNNKEDKKVVDTSEKIVKNSTMEGEASEEPIKKLNRNDDETQNEDTILEETIRDTPEETVKTISKEIEKNDSINISSDSDKSLEETGNVPSVDDHSKSDNKETLNKTNSEESIIILNESKNQEKRELQSNTDESNNSLEHKNNFSDKDDSVKKDCLNSKQTEDSLLENTSTSSEEKSKNDESYSIDTKDDSNDDTIVNKKTEDSQDSISNSSNDVGSQEEDTKNSLDQILCDIFGSDEEIALKVADSDCDGNKDNISGSGKRKLSEDGLEGSSEKKKKKVTFCVLDE